MHILRGVGLSPGLGMDSFVDSWVEVIRSEWDHRQWLSFEVLLQMMGIQMDGHLLVVSGV